MAENKLEVEIGLDLLGLQTGVKKAKKEMQQLEKEMEDLNEAFKKGIITEEQLADETKRNYQISYDRLGKKVKRSNQSIQNLNKHKQVTLGKTTSANATPALQEFSRVIQDAPFGIQGVGNNITQLVSQFGYLSKSTGGAKNALKAMLGALAGPGGILFAVSTLVSLLTVYGDEIANLVSGTKSAKAEQDKLNESLQNYVDNLNSVRRAQVNASQSSAEELTNLRLLFKAVKDLNRPLEERQRAYDDLVKTYPNYFSKQDIDKINTDELTKSYNNLKDAIIAKAKAQAASDLITESEKRRLTLQQQLIDEQENQKKLEEERAKAIKADAAGQLAAQKRGVAFIGTANAATLKLNKSKEKQLELEKQITKENKIQANLEGSVNVADLTLDTSGGGSKKVEKVAKKTFESFRNPFSKFSMPNPFESALAQWESQFNYTPLIGFEPQFDTTGVETAYKKMLITTEELNRQLSEVISQSLANTFMALGDILGNALVGAGNGVESAGDKLLGAMGGLLVSLGQMAISIGTTLLAVDTSLKTLNPFLAIGAGVVLVGLGKAFTNATSKGIGGGRSATDIGSSSGGSAPQTRRYTSGNSASGGVADGNVVFEIQGTKLVGVLNNTLKRNKSIGGANNLLFN